MKIEKFRELSQNDLKHKQVELRGTLLKTKVKVQTKQVENTAQIASLRRDIARVETLLREMAIKGVTTPLATAAAKAAEPAVVTVEKKSKPAATPKDKAAAKKK
jgi:large subunit ribosomal protein L29